MLVRFERVDASRPRGASSAPRMRKSIEELVSRSASRLCTPTKRPKLLAAHEPTREKSAATNVTVTSSFISPLQQLTVFL